MVVAKWTRAYSMKTLAEAAVRKAISLGNDVADHAAQMAGSLKLPKL